MAEQNQWANIAPRILYQAYPDHDLLPIEPPKPGETIRAFSLRAEEAGDTLFLFLCREANDEVDAQEYVARLERAMDDIAAVHAAFLVETASWLDRGDASRPGTLPPL